MKLKLGLSYTLRKPFKANLFLLKSLNKTIPLNAGYFEARGPTTKITHCDILLK